MDHQLILQYVQALGFPICASIAMGWALWRIGNKLMESHFMFMNVIKQQGDEAITELQKQSVMLAKWPSDPAKSICKAEELKGLLEAIPDNCKADDVIRVLELQGRLKPKHP